MSNLIQLQIIDKKTTEPQPIKPISLPCLIEAFLFEKEGVKMKSTEKTQLLVASVEVVGNTILLSTMTNYEFKITNLM